VLVARPQSGEVAAGASEALGELRLELTNRSQVIRYAVEVATPRLGAVGRRS
jgi:hypothetical protein